MKIEAGIFYKTRGGEKVGPITLVSPPLHETWAGYGEDSAITRTYFADGQWIKGEPTDNDLVSEWTDEPTGPVITETVKRIVPGVYGIVRVGGVRYGKALIQVSMAERELWEGADAEQLRAAAATLLEIADALVKP